MNLSFKMKGNHLQCSDSPADAPRKTWESVATIFKNHGKGPDTNHMRNGWSYSIGLEAETDSIVWKSKTTAKEKAITEITEALSAPVEIEPEDTDPNPDFPTGIRTDPALADGEGFSTKSDSAADRLHAAAQAWVEAEENQGRSSYDAFLAGHAERNRL